MVGDGYDGPIYGPTLDQLTEGTTYGGPIYGPTLDQLGVQATTNAAGQTVYSRTQAGQIKQAAASASAWLTANQTAVIIIAGALLLLAMVGGRR
jgi:hypothetical protein